MKLKINTNNKIIIELLNIKRVAIFFIYWLEYKREKNNITNSVITTEYAAPLKSKTGVSINKAKKLTRAPKPTALVLNSCLKEVVSISVKEVAKTFKNKAAQSIFINLTVPSLWEFFSSFGTVRTIVKR